MTPCDFWLFPNLRLGFKDEHFVTIEIIKANMTAYLRAIPINGFQRCFEQLQIRVCVSVWSISVPKSDILEVKFI